MTYVIEFKIWPLFGSQAIYPFKLNVFVMSRSMKILSLMGVVGWAVIFYFAAIGTPPEKREF